MKKFTMIYLVAVLLIVAIVGYNQVYASDRNKAHSEKITNKQVRDQVSKDHNLKKNIKSAPIKLNAAEKNDFKKINAFYRNYNIPEGKNDSGLIVYKNGLEVNSSGDVIGFTKGKNEGNFTPEQGQFGLWNAYLIKQIRIPYPPNGKATKDGLDGSIFDKSTSPEQLQGEIDAFFSQGDDSDTKGIESNKEGVAYDTWDHLMGNDINYKIKVLQQVVQYSNGQPSLKKESKEIIYLFKQANKDRNYDLYKKGSIKLLFLNYYIKNK